MTLHTNEKTVDCYHYGVHQNEGVFDSIVELNKKSQQPRDSQQGKQSKDTPNTSPVKSEDMLLNLADILMEAIMITEISQTKKTKGHNIVLIAVHKSIYAPDCFYVSFSILAGYFPENDS